MHDLSCQYDLKGYHITGADSARKCLIKHKYLLLAIIIILLLLLLLLSYFILFLQLDTILNNEASVLESFFQNFQNFFEISKNNLLMPNQPIFAHKNLKSTMN